MSMRKNVIIIDLNDQRIINRLSNGSTLQKRACKIFQVLLLNYDFKDFVYKTRDNLGIPLNGYDIRKKKDWKGFSETFASPGYVMRDLVSKHSVKLGDVGESSVKLFIEKYKLETITSEMGLFGDSILHTIIAEYIVLNNIALANCDIGIAMKTEYGSGEMEDEIDLRFMAGASKQEMIDFIERYWEEIRILKGKILSDSRLRKRLKISKEFARDIYIYNMYQRLKTTTGYTDIKVAEELWTKGNIKLSEGTIRAIVSKVNKLLWEVNKCSK